MNTCIEGLSERVSESIGVEKSRVVDIIERPPKIEMGDISLPCFTLGENPVETAKVVREALLSESYVKSVEIKGPYLNIFLATNALLESVTTSIPQEKGKVLVEYPSPNLNKPLHIGHARNIAIGKSVSNLLKKQGKTIEQHNLFNDRGVHICKSMVAYQEEGKETPQDKQIKPDHFVGQYYQRFSELAEEDETYHEKAQQMLVEWEDEDEEIVELWRIMREWCLEGVRETLNRLNVKHDKGVFESDIYKEGKEHVAKGLKEGVFQEDEDGAVFIDLEDEDLGVKHVLRNDGTTVYMTQDIGLAIQRFEEGVDEILYVVGKEQQYHFNCLFTILEKLGYSSKSLHHLGYGFVTLTTGKMSSREGTVVLIDDVLDTVVELAQEEIVKRYGERNEERAEKIAISALLFSLLRQDTRKDMVFDPEKSMSFQGETGPYLLYTYARICSVLEPNEDEVEDVLETDEERKLLRELTVWPEKVLNAAETRTPSKVANALLSVAQAYNEFYHAHKIQTEDSKLRAGRQGLTQKTQEVLKDGFEILGLPYVEEM